jgi:stearoyl-CoA desaturase (delta-9 desaturase)
MKNFGFNFWALFVPFHILGLLGLFVVNEHWISLLVLWFIIGVVGNGVAAHRYFAHGQFKTWKPVRWLLAFLTTLGGIGPISYWTIQHKAHHLFTDTELDPHSPKHNSMWFVLYAWTFPQGNNQEKYLTHRWAKVLAVRQMRDTMFKFFHAHHYKIIYAFCLILFLINPAWMLMYCLAYCIDFLRLGLVNYFCHRGGYTNHTVNDSSTNNLWLGWLGMGFGWHNNHHASPGKLVLHERWWEIDVEGYIGWILKKDKFVTK